MSGHSKFTGIKHKKEKNDTTKGRIFTVIGREITVAVEEGGPDPANDSELWNVIAKAKANSVSNNTISNDIRKIAGGLNGMNYEQNVYEGYDPSGVAIIIETLTDDKNHTTANVRAAFSGGGGNVGTPDCVPFIFDRKGQIIIDREEYETDSSELMMFALDAGAGDFAGNEDSYEVLTDPKQLSVVREAFEQKGIPMLEADVKMIPQNWVSLKSEEDQKKMRRILDLLDEDDDIQAVFHSWGEE